MFLDFIVGSMAFITVFAISSACIVLSFIIKTKSFESKVNQNKRSNKEYHK